MNLTMPSTTFNAPGIGLEPTTGLPAWPRHEASKDSIFEFRPDGTAGAGADAWKARLDVMKLATESGKRAD